MNQKKYKIEYEDSIGMGCIEIIHGASEKKAIQNFQINLITEGSYMTQLIDIQEVNDDDGEWTLEDGTPLDENDQELLNYAFETYVNEDGLTMKEVIDNKYK
jgi:hypothetical protein